MEHLISKSYARAHTGTAQLNTLWKQNSQSSSREKIKVLVQSHLSSVLPARVRGTTGTCSWPQQSRGLEPCTRPKSVPRPKESFWDVLVTNSCLVDFKIVLLCVQLCTVSLLFICIKPAFLFSFPGSASNTVTFDAIQQSTLVELVGAGHSAVGGLTLYDETALCCNTFRFRRGSLCGASFTSVVCGSASVHVKRQAWYLKVAVCCLRPVAQRAGMKCERNINPIAHSSSHLLTRTPLGFWAEVPVYKLSSIECFDYWETRKLTKNNNVAKNCLWAPGHVTRFVASPKAWVAE